MKRTVMLFGILVLIVAMIAVGCASNDTVADESSDAESASEDATSDTEAEDAEVTDETSDEGAEVADEELTFALIHCNNSPWQNYMKEYTQIACDELGIELLIYSGDEDGAKNITDLQTVIEMGVDAVLYTPVDNATGAKMEELLTAAETPYIDFDRGDASTVGGLHISFVGPDSVEAGYTLGKYMIEELGCTKFIEIDGNLGSQPGVERKEGFEKILAEHPEVEVLASQAADWDMTKGMNVAQDLLTAYPEADGIWCANDDMALGALSAVEGMGLTDSVLIGGMDCSDEGIEMVVNGSSMKVTIGAHYVCGPIAVITMYDYLHGIDPEENIVFNMLKVDADNAEEFLEINSKYGLIKGKCEELSKYLNPDAPDDRWVTLLDIGL